jgi:hypothetical protein
MCQNVFCFPNEHKRETCLMNANCVQGLVHLLCICRVIHSCLRDLRPVRYSSRDGHAEREHVNRGRATPSFCPTLQVLDMSTPSDAADV